MPAFAAVALLWVWVETRSLAPVGLKLPVSAGSTLLWAAAGTGGVIFVLGDVVNPVIEWVFSKGADHSGYGALKDNGPAAFKLWLYAMFSAAIAEEIVYRGFLLHQLSVLLQKGRAGEWIAILIGGIAFAVPHYSQGLVGVISVALVGFLFGWIFFRSGRNLWSLMLAHALVDTWGIYSLYRGW
ncbi:hypothetical protein LK12_13110 [Novosphingobium malaysiense]|uniref:CAAX prenyl protease 2/Lysostaphin resistance protein A-like domain-containing protein n=1 Tax=Novosphingobium malaysiense TaxID=1348853 RepID=A0A0B1ZRZ6_9SPHN|nr:hypothetical protein LK12_13110 [Novosphingobium malaysiense]